VVRPHLPSAWAWAEVKRLRVGDAYFDIRVERAGTSYRVTTSGGEGWRVLLEIAPA